MDVPGRQAQETRPGIFQVFWYNSAKRLVISEVSVENDPRAVMKNVSQWWGR